VFHSHVKAFYHEEERDLGRGALVLSEDHLVRFARKKFFGGLEEHWYYLSDIVNVKDYDNGFTVEVYFKPEEEEPGHIETIFYEPENEEDHDKWLELLTPKKMKEAAQPTTQQNTPVPQAVRELVKEKETIHEFMVKCPHCDTWYELKKGRCTFCHAAPP
jgi:hypothetical protein